MKIEERKHPLGKQIIYSLKKKSISLIEYENDYVDKKYEIFYEAKGFKICQQFDTKKEAEKEIRIILYEL